MAKKHTNHNNNHNNKGSSDGSKKQKKLNSTNTTISKALQDKYLRDLHRHFKSVYGEDRWLTLSKRLEQPTRHVALVNPALLELSSSQHVVQELLGSGWTPLIPNIVWYYNHHSPDQDDDETLSPPIPTSPVPILRCDSSGARTDGTNDTSQGEKEKDDDDNNTSNKQQQPPEHLSHYLLDGASLLPPLALLGGKTNQQPPPPPPDNCYTSSILDMCAAPGGKSLILYYFAITQDCISNHSTPQTTTTPQPFVLYTNEVNKNRRTRLRRVLESYLPPDVVSEFHQQTDSSTGVVRVSSIDGRQWQQPIDAILVDAPCSSERHILQARGSSPWSLGKVKKEAALQRQLLETALTYATRRVVYSTCSIAEPENDEVVLKTIERMERKYNIVYTIVDPIQAVREQLIVMMKKNQQHHYHHHHGDDTDTSHTNGDEEHAILRGVERTKSGAILLPDRGFGWGPIFWAVLDRVTPQLLVTEA